MAKKVTIHISGSGDIQIKIPKRIARSAKLQAEFSDGLAECVSKTMSIVVNPPPRFHPAMGRGFRG